MFAAQQKAIRRRKPADLERRFPFLRRLNKHLRQDVEKITFPWVWLGRVLVPGVIAVAGVVLLVIGSREALGATLIGIAVIVVIADIFVRLAISSSDDRSGEEEARDVFSRTGRWPRSSRRKDA